MISAPPPADAASADPAHQVDADSLRILPKNRTEAENAASQLLHFQ
jgi:hypothetical protein